MRFVCVSLLVLTACVRTLFAQPASTLPATNPAAAVTDEAFDAALETAASAQPGSEAFVAALQSVAPRFAGVEPSTEPGAGAWRDVTLNTRGKKVDALRFRVLEGDRRDLFWALAFPPGMDRWYIAPVDGPAGKGFSSFLKAPPTKLFKGAAPPGLAGGVVQSLSGQHLEPGREYLIWFVFKDEKPSTISVAIALLPSKGIPSDNGAYKALGLPLAPAEKPVESAPQ